jgi:hypothetical protein
MGELLLMIFIIVSLTRSMRDAQGTEMGTFSCSMRRHRDEVAVSPQRAPELAEQIKKTR